MVPPESNKHRNINRDTYAAIKKAHQRSWGLVRFALISTLFGGTLLGSLNLALFHIFYTRNTSLVRAHGFLQLFGFVLPIAMGMALRLMPPPRIRSAAVLKRFILLFVSIGVPLYLFGYIWENNIQFFGMIFVILGVGFFLTLLLSGLLRGKSRLPPPTVLAYCSAGFLVTSIALNLISDSSEMMYSSFLYGFTLSLVSSVVINMAPSLVGSPSLPHWVRKVTLLIPLGVIAELATLEKLGTGLWALGTLALALAIIRRGRTPREPLTAKRVRICFFWLLLSALTRLMMLILSTFSHTLVADAARHIYTIGFLMQLIFVMLTYLTRAFEGQVLHHPNLFRLGLILLNVSLLFRLFQILAAYTGAWGLYFSGASGVISWFAVLFLVIPIWQTLSTTSVKNVIEIGRTYKENE